MLFKKKDKAKGTAPAAEAKNEDGTKKGGALDKWKKQKGMGGC